MEKAREFLRRLDSASHADLALEPAEEKLIYILTDVGRTSRPAPKAGWGGSVDRYLPGKTFSQMLFERLEILFETGGTFVPNSKPGAVVRVREALPIQLPAAAGVAHHGTSRPVDSGRAQHRRAQSPVALFAAALILISAISIPVIKEVVTAFTLHRSAEVVAAGEGAELLANDSWVSLKVGDLVGAGQTLKTGKDRLVLRLTDESVVRMDVSTYGTLSLRSDDPEIKVGEGKVYVEVNSSGVVSVIVDGIVIASHGPGSSYSVDAGGIVTVTDGSANVRDSRGGEVNVPSGHRYVNGVVTTSPFEGEDTEWINWNRAGGREVDHSSR